MAESKQITQMIAFIETEAREKAREIEIQAMEDFTIEKQKIVESEKLKIRKDYERKEKQVEVQKKIAQSNEIKAARLRILDLRNEAVMIAVKEAHSQLSKLTANAESYKQLLKGLVLQGLLKVAEAKVSVQTRPQDRAVVESILAEAAAAYKEKTGNTTTVTIDAKAQLDSSAAGGVILSALEGRIKCDNTLETRLQLSYELLLPEIRKRLFADATVKL